MSLNNYDVLHLEVRDSQVRRETEESSIEPGQSWCICSVLSQQSSIILLKLLLVLLFFLGQQEECLT